MKIGTGSTCIGTGHVFDSRDDQTFSFGLRGFGRGGCGGCGGSGGGRGVRGGNPRRFTVRQGGVGRIAGGLGRRRGKAPHLNVASVKVVGGVEWKLGVNTTCTFY